MNSIKNNKLIGILLITAIYLMAAAIVIFVYSVLPFEVWAKLLAADVAATVFVFIFSMLFNNASVYDPYWSVQPVVIVTCFAISSKMTTATLLVLISVIYWGVRLTSNWAYTFGGLGSQDWRYTKYQNETGRLYPFVNMWAAGGARERSIKGRDPCVYQKSVMFQEMGTTVDSTKIHTSWSSVLEWGERQKAEHLFRW